jgi:glutamate 5-kinase
VSRLHALGCVPIINENDTVAVEELRFGDNDLLAALMCSAVEADALVILSVVDGLLDAEKKRIDFVPSVREVVGLATTDKSALGTGGMTTKLEAARLVTHAGQIAVVANGRESDVLLKIFDGQDIGTIFAPSSKRLPSRERWIGLTRRPVGTITVDSGAANALINQGKSLLASGITATTGKFESGQVVAVHNADGHVIAIGLSNFSSSEVAIIKGHKSSEFEKLLGRSAHGEAIHRDNMVLHA